MAAGELRQPRRSFREHNLRRIVFRPAGALLCGFSFLRGEWCRQRALACPRQRTGRSERGLQLRHDQRVSGLDVPIHQLLGRRSIHQFWRGYSSSFGGFQHPIQWRKPGQSGHHGYGRFQQSYRSGHAQWHYLPVVGSWPAAGRQHGRTGNCQLQRCHANRYADAAGGLGDVNHVYRQRCWRQQWSQRPLRQRDGWKLYLVVHNGAAARRVSMQHLEPLDRARRGGQWRWELSGTWSAFPVRCWRHD